MLFVKTKKEIIGTIKDMKNISYTLVKEKGKKAVEQIVLYRGKEIIEPWNASKIKLNLLEPELVVIRAFVFDYLKSSTNIKSCLQKMIFPKAILGEIWNTHFNGNKFIKETVLVYQDILPYTDFINEIEEDCQWIVFTQNNYRTKENMEVYKDLMIELTSNFLLRYLSKEKIETYERVYGEWKTLISQMVTRYYNEEVKVEVVQVAIDKARLEKENKEQELFLQLQEIKNLDEAYEKSSISEKLKMEEQVKYLLKEQKRIEEEIKDIKEKENRIKSFI